MNEYNNDSNRGPVTPYRASGNLNTAIGNPQVNINDTMNVNIQSIATNSAPVSNPYSTNVVENSQIQNASTNIKTIQNYQNVQNTQSVQINNIEQPRGEEPKPNPTPVYTGQNINSGTTTTQNKSSVQRTYVTTDNKPKKKTLSLSLGPEFKIGLLIIVILLVFVLFLPMISDLLNGY